MSNTYTTHTCGGMGGGGGGLGQIKGTWGCIYLLTSMYKKKIQNQSFTDFIFHSFHTCLVCHFSQNLNSFKIFRVLPIPATTNIDYSCKSELRVPTVFYHLWELGRNDLTFSWPWNSEYLQSFIISESWVEMNDLPFSWPWKSVKILQRQNNIFAQGGCTQSLYACFNAVTSTVLVLKLCLFKHFPQGTGGGSNSSTEMQENMEFGEK